MRGGFHVRAPRRRKGVALVMILAMIVIVTILLLGFVAKSSSSTTASASFSQSSAAEALARDAGNDIIESLLAEIESKSTLSTSNGITLYQPKTPADVLPELDAGAKAADIAGVPNLLKTSVAGSRAYTNAPESLASEVQTSEPSLNGRILPQDKWSLSSLITPTQNAQSFPSGKTSPDWIYISRSGPVKLQSLSAAVTQSSVNGESNENFVIGRYSYRIYDISGLLDLNVAGFPEVARNAQRIGRKGSLAWLDLKNAALPGYDSSASVTQSLSDWKGPAANYADYADDGGPRYGYLLAPSQASASGANRFFSRQELVELTKAPALAAQFSDAETFLTQATIFSRELNAPSWAPDQATPASPVAMNPAVAQVRVQPGKEFTRADGTPAKAGESLVRTRFPLSKLALFREHEIATGGARAAIEAEIERYFGLKFVASGADGERDFDHWLYFGDTSHGTKIYSFTSPDNGTRECVLTLEDVAKLGREPNFFELLQAGILADSLGQSMSGFYIANLWTDRNIARHVLQIGANIIDQYDEDDESTVIARTPLRAVNASGIGTAGQPDPDICGVENVPYIQSFSQSQFRRFDKPDSFTYQEADGTVVEPYPFLSTYYQFQLWNPHRNASDSEPATYRIVAEGTPVPELVTTAGLWLSPDATSGDIQVFNPGTHWIQFTTPGTHSFSTPHLVQANDAEVSSSLAECKYTTLGASVFGFWAGDINAPYNGIATTDIQNPASSHGYHADVYYQSRITSTLGLTFQLQRRSNSGSWVPVQTIPAIVKSLAYQLSRTIQTKKRGDSYVFHRQPAMGSYYGKADPRSLRFSPGKDAEHATNPGVSADNGEKVVNPGPGEAAFPLTTRFIMGQPAASFQAVNTGSPLLFPSAATGVQRHYELGQLWRNTATAGTYHRERGNQTIRVADTVPENDSPNPLISANARPIVLNRPFKSVAELGYAFRDLPWKSLNLSQDVEGANPDRSTADAALLDLFSLTEAPVRAGVVNLNTASEKVLAALLLGTDLEPMTGADARLSAAEATALASEIRKYLGPRRSPLHVVRTAADISRMIPALDTARGWSKIKREAIVAALADVHNARTWNLLIDVVAQSGRFPSSATNIGSFSVGGQRRLFIHVAIDRYTGRIVDELVESFNES